MLDAQRLAPMQELASQREDAATRDLVQARQLLQTREAQLRELETYEEPPASAISIELLRNREAFRLRLAEAIVQQRRAVDLARRQAESQRQRWIAAHRQTQLYARLIEQAQAHAQTLSQRREQRDLDELALRGAQAGSS